MREAQVRLGLALFGLAGVCALPAWFWEPLGISLFGSLVLWGGAASFAWKGLRALAGRTDVPGGQAPAEPPSSAGPSPTTARTLRHATESTLLTMRRAQVVLALALLVPSALFLAAWGVVTLYRGDLLKAGLMLGPAGFLGWYCSIPLRRAWRAGGTSLL
ncbi:hypothetical protein [Streptomyces sp. NPDC003393]